MYGAPLCHSAPGNPPKTAAFIPSWSSEEIAAKRLLNWTYSELNRSGDHIWWISDVSKFKSHYPGWEFK